jgi:hypothetical protein
MKKILGFILLTTLSFNLFAQSVLESSTALTISPTALVLQTIGAMTESVSGTIATGSLGSLASTVGTIQAKGVNEKKALNNEANQAYFGLVNHQAVNLNEYKALTNMIDELKNNEQASNEITEEASKRGVAFEVIALGSILVATEN